jgi:hypothetical protein
MSGIELSSDPELLRDPHYHKIREIVNSLANTGNAQSFVGNCIASSDILQNLLANSGIPSKIIECQVSIVREDNGQKTYSFVGYDNYSYPGQIDTHTVVVTENENPILIDMSLGHMLPPSHPFVICKANSQNENGLASYSVNGTSLSYSIKKNIRLGAIHQKNLLQRIISEQNMEKSIKTLKMFIACAVGLGLINFTLNIILIILRLFDITLT